MPNRATGLQWDRAIDTAPGADGDRPRRGSLSAQAIVDAAIAVADANGLDAVSIRRVAATLGVRPMSLYTHIASKDELLDLMADQLCGLLVLDELPSGGWRIALGAVARRSHETFVAHPWVLSAFARRPRPGPNTMLHAKQMARAVAELGLESEDVWALLGIVDDFVLGHALRYASRQHAHEIDAAISSQDREEMPELSALRRVVLARDTRESFEIGLQTVLDGIERRFVTRDGTTIDLAQ